VSDFISVPCAVIGYPIVDAQGRNPECPLFKSLPCAPTGKGGGWENHSPVAIPLVRLVFDLKDVIPSVALQIPPLRSYG
jgi:hypothetical protein